jgi:2-polyprenyl-3-methyl-5-hydroxy-6-metoxy-1,4-benzoquinol methylase
LIEAPQIRTPQGETCPACDGRQFRTLFRGEDRLYHTTEKQFLVVECSGCQLMRLYPWPSPDELKTYYPDRYWFHPSPSTAEGLEERYRRFVLRDHVSFVRKALTGAPSEGPILDVGCGGGLFPRMLTESGAPAFGLDFSSSAAQVAWQQNQVPAVCGTLSSAPFAPSTFRLVTMFHVLEHLYDPGAYLEAAFTLLAPNGRLVVQVPNAECWQMLLFGAGWNGLDVPRHLIDFRARDLENLLTSSGFEIIRSKYFSLRDNPAGFATSLAPSLDPMARRVRQAPESSRARLWKDLAYLFLVIAALPVTMLEAACRAGSTVMIEARKP